MDEQQIAVRERLMRLETMFPQLESKVESIQQMQVQVDGKLDTVILELTKYKGRWGGVLLAASAIIAAIKFVLDHGMAWWTK